MNEEIRSLYRTGELLKLKEKIDSKKILVRPQDRYLKQIELGVLNFRLKEYKAALVNFRGAKEIAANLFTVKASKKIESFLLNDANDVYYPSPYELSLIRYYEIMAHYILSTSNETLEKGKPIVLTKKDQRFHRKAIESTLRDWHSHNENLADQSLGKAIFKGTTLADTMSVIFHDYLGSGNDRQKARSFRKIGKKNLMTKMGIYKSFNDKVDNYRDDYSKLHLKSKKEIEKKYLTKTDSYKDLESFLGKKKFNTYIIVMNSYVNPKTAKKFSFPLNLVNIALPFSQKNDFLSFSRKVLYMTHVSNPKIAFELPKIKESSTPITKSYVIKKNGKKISENKSILLANNSEVMGQMINEESLAVKTKVGAKLAVKHAAFLLASYTTYKSLKKSGEFIAYTAASASYAVANKGIEHLEKADLRSWTGVHGQFELIPLQLKPGAYKIDYLGQSFDIVVDKNAKKIIPLFL